MVLGLLALLAWPIPAAQALVLRNLTLEGKSVSVTIAEGKIQSVGGSGPGLDCKGLTVVPGFIDTHVHLGFFKPRELLEGGLTTVRDLGWSPELAFGWKKASRQPEWGPLVLVAGPIVTVKGGYPTRAGWAPADAAAVFRPRMVKTLRESGASVVKVALEPRAGPTLSLGELEQLVREAHQQKLRVAAHVSTLAELDKALDAGVDELVHLVFDDVRIPDATLARIVAQKVVVAPTLRVGPGANRLANLARLEKAGGRIVFGTDLGNGGRAGIDIEELQWMVRAGLPAERILRSATRDAADWLGMPERGRIRVGAVADLLVVEGDPRQDWTRLGRPRLVMRQGRIIVNRI
ncbi:MAG: amidohydrolase family protein [Vulcanimicrobiota bacterium]